jgi:hypothetical protein
VTVPLGPGWVTLHVSALWTSVRLALVSKRVGPNGPPTPETIRGRRQRRRSGFQPDFFAAADDYRFSARLLRQGRRRDLSRRRAPDCAGPVESRILPESVKTAGSGWKPDLHCGPPRFRRNVETPGTVVPPVRTAGTTVPQLSPLLIVPPFGRGSDVVHVLELSRP